MGYEPQPSSNSSGAATTLVAVILVLLVLGVLAVAGSGLLLMRLQSERQRALMQEQRALMAAEQAKAEAKRAFLMAERSAIVAQSIRSFSVASEEPEQAIEVALDREGNARVNGDAIDLTDFRSYLVAQSAETGKTVLVTLNVDPECLFKDAFAWLEATKEVEKIDVRFVTQIESQPRAEAAGSTR